MNESEIQRVYNYLIYPRGSKILKNILPNYYIGR